jgi:hypothetical protein
MLVDYHTVVVEVDDVLEWQLNECMHNELHHLAMHMMMVVDHVLTNEKTNSQGLSSSK